MSLRLVGLVFILALLSLGPPGASAFESYHNPSLDGEGYCSTCHPGFLGGFAGALHQLHFITFTCSLCHTGAGFDNPFIMWSQGNKQACRRTAATGCGGTIS
jgi:hypothetical protein